LIEPYLCSYNNNPSDRPFCSYTIPPDTTSTETTTTRSNDERGGGERIPILMPTVSLHARRKDIVDIQLHQSGFREKWLNIPSLQASRFSVSSRSWINLDVKCESCGKRLTVRKDDPTAHELPLNEALSLALSRGWDTQLHDTSLNCCRDDFVHDTTFHKAEQELASGLSGAIMEDMKNAIQEECICQRRWEGCHN